MKGTIRVNVSVIHVETGWRADASARAVRIPDGFSQPGESMRVTAERIAWLIADGIEEPGCLEAMAHAVPERSTPRVQQAKQDRKPLELGEQGYCELP